MNTESPRLNDSPYTDADLAAIISAPQISIFANMNPFLEARLQHFAVIEVELQAAGSGKRENVIAGDSLPGTTSDRADQSNGFSNWTWELAQLFNQCFSREHGEPFVRFYREASRRLINSESVRDKGIDLNYLLFEMQQGKPEELSDETILDTLCQQREKA